MGVRVSSVHWVFHEIHGVYIGFILFFLTSYLFVIYFHLHDRQIAWPLFRWQQTKEKKEVKAFLNFNDKQSIYSPSTSHVSLCVQFGIAFAFLHILHFLLLLVYPRVCGSKTRFFWQRCDNMINWNFLILWTIKKNSRLKAKNNRTIYFFCSCFFNGE